MSPSIQLVAWHVAFIYTTFRDPTLATTLNYGSLRMPLIWLLHLERIPPIPHIPRPILLAPSPMLPPPIPLRSTLPRSSSFPISPPKQAPGPR